MLLAIALPFAGTGRDPRWTGRMSRDDYIKLFKARQGRQHVPIERSLYQAADGELATRIGPGEVRWTNVSSKAL